MTNETESPTRIQVNLIEDGARVYIDFRWRPERYEPGVSVHRSDGSASLGVIATDARELHRKLGAALKSPEANGIDPDYEQARADWESEHRADWADAGHPDPEEKMAEAEARGDPDPCDDGDCLMRAGRAHYTTECPTVEAVRSEA